MKRIFALALAALLLNGCFDEDPETLPPAVTLTDDALGYYCRMIVNQHPGPKAQIHLAGQQEPLFFTQVRDAIAYQRMPEQSDKIAAIYVNDMGTAASWDRPGVDNWIPAGDADYVVGSSAVGGMGAAELVPFASRDAAVAFAAQNGGQVQRLDDVPDDAVLGPDQPVAEGSDENLYHERLKALTGENGG